MAPKGSSSTRGRSDRHGDDTSKFRPQPMQHHLDPTETATNTAVPMQGLEQRNISRGVAGRYRVCIAVLHHMNLQ